ncbi:MAG TPA: polyprenyl synthetase family protein [Cyclobacteriaceae bacterium]|nr:polyprenyl synthetase family protein [Cyclobacteriaceae bacterium]
MIESYLSLIEKEITQLPLGSHPKSLYDPIRYIMKLGGKRLRPLLTCLSYSMYKEDVHMVIPYAAAVEAFHNFTLMHDDIMDKAPLRRGKPTVHEKFNSNTAILSGDVMLVKVYDMLLPLPAVQLQEVLKLFNRTASEVCEGQQLDMDFESLGKVSEKQYLEMIRLKTAVLLGFCLEFGAMLAIAPEDDRRALYDFGVNIGIGFQLMDDLLDVYADKAKFGKQVGGDIVSNKKTFLLVKALGSARGKSRTELKKWLSLKKFDKRKKISAVTAIYNSLGIREATEKMAEKYFEEGYRCLDRIDNPKKAQLISFARSLSARQK